MGRGLLFCPQLSLLRPCPLLPHLSLREPGSHSMAPKCPLPPLPISLSAIGAGREGLHSRHRAPAPEAPRRCPLPPGALGTPFLQARPGGWDPSGDLMAGDGCHAVVAPGRWATGPPCSVPAQPGGSGAASAARDQAEMEGSGTGAQSLSSLGLPLPAGLWGWGQHPCLWETSGGPGGASLVCPPLPWREAGGGRCPFRGSANFTAHRVPISEPRPNGPAPGPAPCPSPCRGAPLCGLVSVTCWNRFQEGPDGARGLRVVWGGPGAHTAGSLCPGPCQGLSVRLCSANRVAAVHRPERSPRRKAPRPPPLPRPGNAPSGGEGCVCVQGRRRAFGGMQVV